MAHPAREKGALPRTHRACSRASQCALWGLLIAELKTWLWLQHILLGEGQKTQSYGTMECFQWPFQPVLSSKTQETKAKGMEVFPWL